MTDAVAIILDLHRGTLRLKFQILQYEVGNGKAPLQEYAPKIRISKSCNLPCKNYGGRKNYLY